MNSEERAWKPLDKVRILLVKTGEGAEARSKSDLANLAKSHGNIQPNHKWANGSDSALVIVGFRGPLDRVVCELATGWTEVRCEAAPDEKLFEQ